MKPIKAYLNILNGKVVASTVEKPVITKGNNALYWHRILAEFESSILGEVVNAHVSQHPVGGHDEITVTKSVWQMAEPNHPCQVEVGDKVTVITPAIRGDEI